MKSCVKRRSPSVGGVSFNRKLSPRCSFSARMDATQMIDDSVLESDEEDEEEENERGEPLAKLQVLKNKHIPETELPLYLGENVLGRDANTCNLPLLAHSVSKQHTTICLTVYRGTKEALVWDMGSMNGTRIGRRKLTPHVRYALSEGDSLLVADIPCQYVSCPVDKTPSQDERNPVDSGDSSRAQDSEAGTSKDNEKSVNGNKKALARLLMVSDEEESWKTPARSKAFCSDKSRTQLQETLVPESDSDEDQEGRPGWRGKTVVSESDSMTSPRSNLIPESPITPSSIKRPKKHVSFSEESDVDAGRQQLRRKSSQVMVDDSEEEEEPRKVSLLGGREPERSGQVLGEKASNSSLPEEDGSPVSKLAAHAVAKPAFNMDSDTDEEGDKNMSECGAVQPASRSPAADPPAKLSQFHMDSDTDVDEENESHVVIDAGAVSVPASDDVAKPARRIPSLQPTGLTAEDSDTDDEIVSETATKSSPISHHESTATVSAPSRQPIDYHPDSDTDVEEEVQGVDSGPKNAGSKLEASRTVLSNSGGIESMSAAPSSNLCLDSDTDDEIAVPVETVQLTGAVVDTGVDLEILSDSDTDLEEDAPLLPPVVANEASATPSSLTKVMTDSSSTAGAAANVDADLSRVSSTDIEESGEEGGELAGEGQFSGNSRIPPLQFSTPKGLLEGGVEEMETQAFLNSSPDPFKRPFPARTRPVSSSSSCSDSQEDDVVVAETQSFILETRDRQANLREDLTLDETQSFALEPLSEDQEQATTAGDSFQSGLSDSSQLAMETTQNFVSLVGDVHLEATQAYLAVPPADTEYDLAMEATQVYGGEEKEPTQQIDVATEATQAYIPVSDSDTEDEGFSDARTDLATAETQPLDDEGFSDARTELATAETQPLVVPSTSAVAMAETQLMCADEEDVAEVKSSLQEVSTCVNLSSAETQPMTASNESLPVDMEVAQPVTNAADTQPAEATSDLFPASRKRTAKSQRLVESQSESPLATTLLYTAETLPIAPASETEGSDEDEPIPVTRKRTGKAKRLVESQESQLTTFSSLSTAETQPIMSASESEENDEEEPLPVTRKRRTKAQRLIESQESPLVACSDVSAAETEIVSAHDGVQADEQVTKPLSLKRRGRSWTINPLEEAIEEGGKEDEPKAEAQMARCPRGRGKGREVEAGPSSIGRRGRSARGVAAEDQEEPAGPSRRQTRGKGQTTSRGRRGRVAVPEEEAEGGDGECEEEEKVELVTRGRGRKASKQQSDKRAEEEALEQEHKEVQGRLQMEQDERERIEREKRQREERTRQEEERLAREMAEREEREKRERVEREEKERLEREEEERIERERKEREEKERSEKIRKERELRERKEREEQEKLERENSERERKEQEEMERIQQERERLERERREEEERIVREMAEREEREKRERMEREKERLEIEEKERMEREEKERIQKENEERERLEREKKEEKERLQKEAVEKRQEEQARVLQAKQEVNPKTPARGRRATRTTTMSAEALEPELNNSTSIGGPAHRTRSRSNSSNSVSSETSLSSINSQERGQSRGTMKSSRPTAGNRTSGRRATVTGESSAKKDRVDVSNSEISSSSASSLGRGRGRGRGRRTDPNPETVVVGGSQIGQASAPKTPARGRKIPKVEAASNDASQSAIEEKADSQQPGTTRGRRRAEARDTELTAAAVEDQTTQVEESAKEDLLEPNVEGRGQGRKGKPVEAAVDVNEEAEAKKTGRGKGRKRDLEEGESSKMSQGKGKVLRGRKAAAADDEEEGMVEANEDEPAPAPANKGVRAQGKQSAKVPCADGESKVESEKMEEETPRKKGKGRPSAAQKKTEERQEDGETSAHGSTDQDAGVSSQVPETPNVSRKRGAPMESSTMVEPAPAPASKGGRARGRQSATVPCADGESKVESEKMEEETPRKRGKGRPSAAQKKEERQEDGETSAHGSTDQDASVSTSQVPETPNGSRKRGAPMESSSTTIKSPRLSGRAANQACKVLFTGVADETGEKVVSRLGGSLARDVRDMTYLVTDKVRRTVKFLCAVARGIPIVNTQWLQKCGKAGSFLPPNGFIVKDMEQEQKFNFCLQESLRTASNQPLLQGYEIHVTKSVLPEPVHMKDIISCSGAKYLPKMPSKHKAQTVVVSCEVDWALCSPAVSASLPIVTAEFILTGILQQKVDLETHVLSVSAAPQVAAGRGRGRKKS